MRSLRTKWLLACGVLAMGLAACGPGEDDPDGGGGDPGPGPGPVAAMSLHAGSLQRAGSADGNGEAAGFNTPEGVALDSAGNIYVADTGNHTIRKLAPDGSVTTLAGAPGQPGSADGTGAAARFSSPRGVAADASGNVYVADTGNHTVRRIAPGGAVTTLAGAAGQAGTADGPAATARLNAPTGIALAPGGVLLVGGDSAVRRIAVDGGVSTFAGAAGQPGVVVADGAQARFMDISGVAVDGSGNVYVAESRDGSGGSGTGRLRRFNTVAQSVPLGTSTTPNFLVVPFAAGIAADAAGNVYLASGGSVNLGGPNPAANPVFRAVYRVTPQGVVALLAGTNAQGSVTLTIGQAPVLKPRGVAVDGTGRVVFSDADNHAIRRIDAQNTLSTLAGGAGIGRLDGAGALARFHAPLGLAAATDGTLYVADSLNRSVRRISTAGAVSTLQLTGGGLQPLAFDAVWDVAVRPQGGFYALTLSGSALAVQSCDATGRCNPLETGSAAGSVQPWGIATASANLYLAENSQVSVIGSNGVKQVLATGFVQAANVVAGPGGKVYVADTSQRIVQVFNAQGGLLQTVGTVGNPGHRDGAAAQALFDSPASLALDAAGNLYIADNGTVRKLSADGGTVSTLAGVPGRSGAQMGPATGVLGAVQGMAWHNGSLYVTVDNAVVKISPVN